MMAAPNNPNTTNAVAARRRIGDQAAIDRLVKAGYIVIPLGIAAETIRRAIADPGAILPRAEGETVAEWGARAVIATITGEEAK